MKQNIIPNQCIFFAGDIVKIEIFDAPKSSLGKAFLRTNLGNKSSYRSQIIDQIDKNIPYQAQDQREWKDRCEARYHQESPLQN